MRWALSGLLIWLGLGCSDVHPVSLGSHMLIDHEVPDAGSGADAQPPDAAKPDAGDDHGDDTEHSAEADDMSGEKSGDDSGDKPDSGASAQESGGSGSQQSDDAMPQDGEEFDK